jgi:hypothetical protein
MKLTPFVEEALKEHREYWQSQLAGELADCGILHDFPRPTKYARPPEQMVFEIPDGTYKRVRSICGPNESLLFTLLVTALKVCLRLYSGQDDIRIGTTIRRQDEQTAIYNKVVVLRDFVSGTLSFQELTSRVKQTLIEAYEHQVYPFEHLVALLNCNGVVNRSPLFDVAAILDSIERFDMHDRIPPGTYVEINHRNIRPTLVVRYGKSDKRTSEANLPL